MNPDGVDFPNPMEQTDAVAPSRPVSSDHRGVARRQPKKREKKNKEEVKEESLEEEFYDEEGADIYDSHEHKKHIGSEHHRIDKKA